MSEPAIRIDGLTKRFGQFTAVDGLSFEVQQGEIFGLLGPNGSGKTTTVNMISGLSWPTAGTVTVMGRDIVRDTRQVRQLLGSVPQETALYEELSAQANLRFHADLFGMPLEGLQTRIDALLDLVQLSDRRKDRVSTFSGGMKRRLALARALLHEPKLLYLDEPTLGVDVQSRRALWDYILAQKKHGLTVLITSNYLEEANALCDRIAILDHGKLVALDTPDRLKRRYGATVLELVTEKPLAADTIEQLRELPGVTDLQSQDGTTVVTLAADGSSGDVVTHVTGATRLQSITQRNPSLDEVFLALTGRELRD
jgi:ABC-2 type transport system ATP-binding protein